MVDPYYVVKPQEVYLGRTYTDWIADYINWFFSKDPEAHNSGPVVFLKSFPRVTRLEKAMSEGMSDDEDEYEANTMMDSFRNNPNVMVGDDRLEIFQDQAIFFPVILAYWAANERYETEAFLRRKVRSDIDNGDNPPNNIQVTIDLRETPPPPEIKKRKSTPINVEKMRDYRFETPLFPLLIPEAKSGESLKDYVENPVPSGSWQAVCSGYFFLLSNLQPNKDYIIHSYAKGRSTEKGDYWAEFLYQIRVRPNTDVPTSPRAGRIPERILFKLLMKLKIRRDRGELSEQEYEDLKHVIYESRSVQERSLR